MSVAPFVPRQLSTGRMLKTFDSENVSIMLKVEDALGKSFTGIATDKTKVRVNLPEPQYVRKDCWVEVIGKVTSSDTIRAKEVIQFAGEHAETFNEDAYEYMVVFMNNCKQFFKFSQYE